MRIVRGAEEGEKLPPDDALKVTPPKGTKIRFHGLFGRSFPPLSERRNMRNWGSLVTAFYVLAVVCFIAPGVVATFGSGNLNLPHYLGFYVELLKAWQFWLWAGVLIGGEALLLLISVDTSRRFRPRQHIAASIVVTTTFIALLTHAAAYSLLAGIFGKNASSWRLLNSGTWFVVLWLILWAFWGVVFFFYMLGRSITITRSVRWVVTGSVLELLIVVPCHIIVRRRNDCSAPFYTSYGIATGLAVMLLAFGPSVLFLYRKQFQRYRRPPLSGISSYAGPR